MSDMTAPTALLEQLTLTAGGHRNFQQGACLLEAASYIAGEAWSDHPECVSSVLGYFGRSLNDRLSDVDRQKLKPFIPRLLNTANDGQDDARRFLSSDWAIRVATPRWLDAAGLSADAQALRSLPPIVDYATLESARSVARAARDNAYAARVKSRQGLQDRVRAELKKRGINAAAAADAVADAAAVADADAVAVAVAAAVAVADAVADAVAAAVAVAVAAAAADAAAVAVAVADAVADADAVAVAVADAVADADAAADFAKYSPSWYRVYDSVYAAMRKRWQGIADGSIESKLTEIIRLNNEESIELFERMIDPKSNATEGEAA